MKSASLILVASLILAGVCCHAQPTPPVAPKIQATPLPAPVELPPPDALPADVPNRPLTADEAARIALRNQPNIASARGGLTAARGRTQQARSGLGPLVAVSTGYTDFETLSGAGGGGGGGLAQTGSGSVSVQGWGAFANLRQLIFDFNHTRDLVRQSSALERAASQNLTRTQADTVLQVKQAFYTYAQNERLVTVNESNVRNQQDHLALAQARLRTGLGLPSDVVRAQTAVSEAIFNLNLARNNASVSRVNLAELMGIDPRTPIRASDSGEPQTGALEVNRLVNSALIQRPEMLQAQANVEAAKFARNAARSSNAPSFAANLGLSSRGQNFPPNNDSFSVGASVSFDPFDSGLTAGRIKEARGNLEVAEATLTSTRLSVTADVSQAYLNLRTAEQRVVTADSEVANAEESVRLAEGRYRSGLGTFIDVTDAQAALLTARTNRINAQSAVDQARAALARAIGSGLPR